MKKLLWVVGTGINVAATAQESTSKALITSGYAKAYYSYDFNKPANYASPGFLFNYNRHNEFDLNLGFIKAAYAVNSQTKSNTAITFPTAIGF